MQWDTFKRQWYITIAITAKLNTNSWFSRSFFLLQGETGLDDPVGAIFSPGGEAKKLADHNWYHRWVITLPGIKGMHYEIRSKQTSNFPFGKKQENMYTVHVHVHCNVYIGLFGHYLTFYTNNLALTHVKTVSSFCKHLKSKTAWWLTHYKLQQGTSNAQIKNVSCSI